MSPRIDFRSGKPVYRQVVDQIKAAAVSGTLRSGEALPSVSALSAELRVNRNTVARAYAELEGLDLIEIQPGGGYVIKESRRPSRGEIQRGPPPPGIDDNIVRAPFALEAALLYGLLLMTAGAVYLGLVLAGAGAVLSLAAAAAVSLPLRGPTGKVSHRIIFAKRFELPRLLNILQAEALAQPDLHSFMERVISRTEAAIGARLELIQDRARVMSLVHSFPALRTVRAPVTAGADLLMPVFCGDEVHGALRLAPKSNGRPYDAHELKFLASLGEQVGIAANRFRLRHERQESEYALDIQRGLLPREIPQVPGFTIAGAWQPARTVGGDYYDVFPIGDSELALVIADVAGKGIPAALLMSNLQATVKAYATVERSPKDLAAKVNRAVCGSIASGRFITFFCAVLEPAERRFTYTNAGHNPPLLVRQEGECLKLEPNGPVLGVFGDAIYEQATVELMPGDRLVLFTDGITEAADANGEEFGEERLMKRVRESPAVSAADLRNEIMQRVTQFCRGDFADDATLLSVVVDAYQITFSPS